MGDLCLAIAWNKDQSEVDIKIFISEGLQTSVLSVSIYGIPDLLKEQAVDILKIMSDQPFEKHLLAEDEDGIVQLLVESGYPHASVESELFFTDNNAFVDIEYTVQANNSVKIGNIYYTGNFRTKQRVLARMAVIKTGDPFSRKKVLQAQRNIRNMDIFNTVNLKMFGLKEGADEITLFVEMEEKKPYFFEMGGGYESQQGFFSNIRAGDHNLLGKNKDAWIGSEASQIHKRIEFEVKEPNLFNSRVIAGFDWFTEERKEFNKDFGTLTYGSALKLTKKFTRYFTTNIHVQYEQREQFKRDENLDQTLEETSPQEYEKRSLITTTPSISFDTRDSFLRPKHGIYSSLFVEISTGLKNSLDDFIKTTFDLRFYTTPLKPVTFAWIIRTSTLETSGDDKTLPEDQLLFLGGTSDIRGFEENMLAFDSSGNPLGGRSILSSSVEARLELGLNIELALFTDTGIIRRLQEQKEPESFRSSAGVGLRYLTPIGPVGFLYGTKLNPKEHETRGRVHFAMGYTF